jgi:P-type conjugative transfer protein TrbJ
MDWQTILTAVVTSLLSSSLITAGVVYLVKKGIDRTIDLRYEQMLEKTRLQAQEQSRRQAALYDQQTQALQALVAHVHRLRRLARDLGKLTSPDKRSQKTWKEFDQLHQEFEQRFQECQEFISTQRALLTDDVLGAQHDVTGLAASVKSYRQVLGKTAEDGRIQEHASHIQTALEQLEEEYVNLLRQAQIRLGILKDHRSR